MEQHTSSYLHVHVYTVRLTLLLVYWVSRALDMTQPRTGVVGRADCAILSSLLNRSLSLCGCQTDGWKGVYTEETHGCTDGQMDKQRDDRWTDRQVDAWTDGQTDGRTDGQTDRWIDVIVRLVNRSVYARKSPAVLVGVPKLHA